MLLVSWEWMIEDCSLRQLIEEFPSECYASSQFIRPLKDSFAHALKLRSCEVPLGSDIVLHQIFINRTEQTDFIPVILHYLKIICRHGKFYRGNQIYFHL